MGGRRKLRKKMEALLQKKKFFRKASSWEKNWEDLQEKKLEGPSPGKIIFGRPF